MLELAATACRACWACSLLGKDGVLLAGVGDELGAGNVLGVGDAVRVGDLCGLGEVLGVWGGGRRRLLALDLGEAGGVPPLGLIGGAAPGAGAAAGVGGVLGGGIAPRNAGVACLRWAPLAGQLQGANLQQVRAAASHPQPLAGAGGASVLGAAGGMMLGGGSAKSSPSGGGGAPVGDVVGKSCLTSGADRSDHAPV